MKNVLRLLCILFALSLSVSANAEKKQPALKYDIVNAGAVGAQGTYLCKVTVYTKSKSVKEDDLLKAAVHGVIFKGVPGGNGIATQRPMTNPTVEYEHADFFNTFFAEGGPYRAYANVEPTSIVRAKIATGETRVSAIVSVSKDELRKYLEQAGIVKGLGGGLF